MFAQGTDTSLQTALTDGSGRAALSVPPGGYRVCVVAPAGWSVTYPSGGCYYTTLSPGVTTLDFLGVFTNAPTATLAPPTATPAPTITPLPGSAVVTFYTLEAGTWAALPNQQVTVYLQGESTVHQTAQSDATGLAQVSLVPGGYRICQSAAVGWAVTYPAGGCYYTNVLAGSSSYMFLNTR